VDIMVHLNEEQAKRLQKLAQSLAVEPTELARAAWNDLLTRGDDDFQRAASYVLQKNRELYERLA